MRGFLNRFLHMIVTFFTAVYVMFSVTLVLTPWAIICLNVWLFTGKDMMDAFLEVIMPMNFSMKIDDLIDKYI